MKTEVYQPIYRIVCLVTGALICVSGRKGWASYDAAKAAFLEDTGTDIASSPVYIVGKYVYDFD